MHITTFLTPGGITDKDLQGRTAVVVDVLRASTSIVAALTNGAKDVIPAPDQGAAGRISANLDESVYVLAGERDGLKIDGFHVGNSPLEFEPDVVAEKTLIIKTTNGTDAILAARAAEEVIVGCFSNLTAVANHIIEQDRDVVIICSGWYDRASLEDTMFCGALVSQLESSAKSLRMDDGSGIALDVWENSSDDWGDVIKASDHAGRLDELGHSADVDYAIRMDRSDIVPVFVDNRLIISGN